MNAIQTHEYKKHDNGRMQVREVGGEWAWLDNTDLKNIEGRYSVKNVQLFSTPDGGGYNCSLYKDGNRIADLHEAGHGGCIEYTWRKRDEAQAFYDFVKSVFYYCDYTKADVSHSPETFIGELIDEFDAAKKMRARCKKYIIVKYKEDEKGSYRTFKTAPTPEMIAKVKELYGEKIEFFYNEKVA